MFPERTHAKRCTAEETWKRFGTNARERRRRHGLRLVTHKGRTEIEISNFSAASNATRMDKNLQGSKEVSMLASAKPRQASDSATQSNNGVRVRKEYRKPYNCSLILSGLDSACFAARAVWISEFLTSVGPRC